MSLSERGERRRRRRKRQQPLVPASKPKSSQTSATAADEQPLLLRRRHPSIGGDRETRPTAEYHRMQLHIFVLPNFENALLCSSAWREQRPRPPKFARHNSLPPILPSPMAAEVEGGGDCGTKKSKPGRPTDGPVGRVEVLKNGESLTDARFRNTD